MKAVVEIKGGFGNQIFQYSFANHLKKIDVDVSINIQNQDEFILDSHIFEFKKASKLYVRLLKILYKISESKKFKIFDELIFSKFFSKSSKPEHFQLNNLRYLNHFDGYWQDVEILVQQKDFIIDCLKKIEAFRNFSQNIPNRGSTLLHVRRGDYLNVNENLNDNFYVNSIEYCQKNIENFHFDIFTDDFEWVKNNKIFNSANNIYGPSSDMESLLIDVAKMFNYENFIIGNSSFSLIPAVLSEVKSSKILYADPWFRNSKRNLNFNINWIGIENK